MKKILTLAVVLVMAMVVLTACGETLVAPNGAFASESGTYKAEFSGWDEKANSGNLTITFTVMDTPEVVSGTFAVAVNDPDAGTYFVDFTPNGAETIEGFMIYDPNQNVVAQYKDVDPIAGSNTTYYASTGDAEGEAAPEEPTAE